MTVRTCRTWAMMLLLALAAPLSHAQQIKEHLNFRCVDGKSFSQRVNDYSVKVVPTGEPDIGFCKVIVSNGKTSRTITTDWAVSVLPLSGKDLNGDEIPDLLLETYTGGAHCCWNYWVVSLGPEPEILLHLYNERGAGFSRALRGKPIIETTEGGFDYLRTSHAASFFPAIFLQLEGRQLYDISCEFTSEYDRHIAEAKAELRRLDPENKAPGAAVSELDESIRAAIMTIISSYLYSNRPNEAWKALDAYWPKDDRTALKQDILRIRREGLLRHATRKRCTP